MRDFIDLSSIVESAYKRRASDIHLVVGTPIKFRIDGKLVNFTDCVLTDSECEAYARMLSNNYEAITEIGEQDVATGFPCGVRCRVNLFRQQGHLSIALRLLNEHIPAFDDLGLPSVVKSFTNFKQGIVIVSGETGSGKSTTLAALLNEINHNQQKHIITLEDPIEYIYTPDQCLINQREIGQDTRSYSDGLKAVLREDPDIILIGEMRYLDTIETALIAAETGHLVFATLHANSAADAIDRIVDVFPTGQQAQIRMQLSMTLQAIVCQQLLPKQIGTGRILASEVMVTTSAIKNLIREGKTPQIANSMATSGAEGCTLMDASIIKLAKDRKISTEVACLAAHDAEYVQRSILF